MDSDLPPARPRRVVPHATAYSIVETQPRGRRAGPVRAVLALTFMAGLAGAMWVMIGMAVWRLFH
ncbi:hypothetical protein [Phenylobacterium sp.]|uniref:hypothetical protein n=1 Tax=Phenylobacterium sp. TaxID=1871053 RepID=UPI0028110174|nr:hypothetical protein [Phenylobacterium sp.]